MKKFFVVATAVCLALMMAVPAMATDISTSGTYRIRGFSTYGLDMRDTSATDSYINQRFRLNTVFQVDDTLKFTVRFDALDGHLWGQDGATSPAQTGAAAPDDAGTNWDRAYITWKTEFGAFQFGRQTGGTFGNTIFDYEGDSDRIKWSMPYGDWAFILIYQKYAENDHGISYISPGAVAPGTTGALTTLTSGTAAVSTLLMDERDQDGYFAATVYKQETWQAGLLYGFLDVQTTAGQATQFHLLNPYFNASFGPLDIQGEMQYQTGQTEYDATPAGVRTDVDIDQLAYNLELGYDFGPFQAFGGYLFFEGDGNTTDNENGSYTNGVGTDWEPLWLLCTDEDGGISTALGGLGNLNRNSAPTHGASLFYGGASFSPWENVTLGFAVGNGTADDAPVGWDDDFGTEWDATFKWKLHDNLSYRAIFAFLDSGDYFKQGAAAVANFDDVVGLFHELQIKF